MSYITTPTTYSASPDLTVKKGGIFKISDFGGLEYISRQKTTFGSLAYKDLVEAAMLGTTIISGGYIKTDLIDADTLLTDVLFVGDILDGGYLKPSLIDVSTLVTTIGLQAMAYESAVEFAKLGTTLVSGGYIKTTLLDTNAILTNVLFVGDADKTQTVLDAGASLDYAKVGGSTLIYGGVIRTSLLSSSILYVGQADLTQSALNAGADVTYAKVGGYTLVSGGYIRTTLIDTVAIRSGLFLATDFTSANINAQLTSSTLSFSTAGKVTFGNTSQYIYGTSSSLTINGGAYNYIKQDDTSGVTLSSSKKVSIDGTSATTIDINSYSGVVYLRTSYNNVYIGSGSSSYGLYIQRGGLNAFIFGSAGLYPTDNTYGNGGSGYRWKDIWSVDGTIHTSDAKEKSSIEESDLGLGFINKLSPKKWIWNDGIRTHYGLVAQDVEDIMLTDSLDFAGLIKNNMTVVSRDVEENPGEEKSKSSTIKKEEVLIETKDVRDTDTCLKSYDSYGLRYHEFIGPIIKAIQELSDRMTKLEEKL